MDCRQGCLRSQGGEKRQGLQARMPALPGGIFRSGLGTLYQDVISRIIPRRYLPILGDVSAIFRALCVQ